MKRQGTFPFTAIIGQDTMKRALVLNVVNPKLGGVLIQGEKGRQSRPLCELLLTFFRRAAASRDAVSMMIRMTRQTGVMNAMKNTTMQNRK